MLQPVAVGSKTLADYTHIVGRDLIAEIREPAEPLQGCRVVHIPAAAFGGGVSEILYLRDCQRIFTELLRSP